MLQYDAVVLPEILAILSNNQYDMIICDSYFAAVCFLKQMTDIPVVSSHSSFALSKCPVPEQMLKKGVHPQLDHCYEVLDQIVKGHHLKPLTMEEVFLGKSDRNIVYTSQTFNNDVRVTEPEYLFVGPSLDRAMESRDIDISLTGYTESRKKHLYIALGSINNNNISFYKQCLTEFSKDDYVVCMSIGTKCKKEDLGEIPNHFIVENHLPQIEILKKTDVFITHAGFNSVNEALFYGVPMFCLPQANDQHMIAKQITALNLGISAKMTEITDGKLLAGVEKLIHNSIYRESCKKFSDEMRSMEKVDEVVKKLEEYAQKWR